MEKHLIDATDKSLGRVASEAARILLGKNSVKFAKNKVADCNVCVANASKIKISDKKLKNNKYTRYSGYPGGLKIFNLEMVIAKKGVEEVVRQSVRKMLPRNRLLVGRMKRLTVTK